MDSYISDELLVETNHEVLRHLENCPACRYELGAHRDLRKKTRSAVRNAPDAQMNSAFAANLRIQLRETALRPRWWELAGDYSFFNQKNLLTAAMSLLFFVCIGLVWVNYRNSSTATISVAENQTNTESKPNRAVENLPPDDSSTAQAVQVALRETTDLAVGDHKNCALKFRLKEKPISLEEAAVKYEKFNKGLEKVVVEAAQAIFTGNSGGEIKMLAAHSCVFNGRRFAHIVLQRQNHVISVLTTASDSSLPDPDAAAIVSQTTDNMQVASFQTKNHLVFVVSNLDASDNMTVARNVIPAVSRHLGKFEV